MLTCLAQGCPRAYLYSSPLPHYYSSTVPAGHLQHDSRLAQFGRDLQLFHSDHAVLRVANFANDLGLFTARVFVPLVLHSRFRCGHVTRHASTVTQDRRVKFRKMIMFHPIPALLRGSLMSRQGAGDGPGPSLGFHATHLNID